MGPDEYLRHSKSGHSGAQHGTSPTRLSSSKKTDALIAKDRRTLKGQPLLEAMKSILKMMSPEPQTAPFPRGQGSS